MKKMLGILFVFLMLFLLFKPAFTNQKDQIKADFDHVKKDFDPKHTPKIEAPDQVAPGEWFNVTVSVGAGAEHPTMDTHFVKWIALYKEDVEIARAYFSSVYSKPVVTFTIALDKSATLRALEEPNHSAPFESSKPVKVAAPETRTEPTKITVPGY